MATFNLLLIENSDSFKPYLIGLLRIRYKDMILFSAQNPKQMATIAKKVTFPVVIADIQFLSTIVKGSEYAQVSNWLKNVALIVLHGKKSSSLQMQSIYRHFPNLKLLQKPFKPASLYHLIDSLTEQGQKQNTDMEINLPAWAIQDKLNLRVLCQNFRNDREKVIKILKLYPAQVRNLLTSIEQALQHNQKEQLINELQSLKTSLIYFADENLVGMVDQIRQYAEDNTADNANIAQLLAKFKNQWETLQKQIQEM